MAGPATHAVQLLALCLAPLALAAPLTPGQTAPAAAPPLKSSEDPLLAFHQEHPTGTIIGVAVGAVAFVLLGGGVATFVIKKRAKKRAAEAKAKAEKEAMAMNNATMMQQQAPMDQGYEGYDQGQEYDGQLPQQQQQHQQQMY